jgi:hypothetical protein
MRVVLNNVRFSNGGTAISMPAGATIDATNLTIEQNKVGIEVREESQAQWQAGTLAEIHWIDVLAGCFATIRQSKGRSSDERRAAFRSSGLGRMLAPSHNVDVLLEQLFAAEAQAFTLESMLSASMREWLVRSQSRQASQL